VYVLSLDPKEKKLSVIKVAKLVPAEAAPLKMISFAKRKKRKRKDKNAKEVDPEISSLNRKTDVARSA
jgi:hypothetical protein